jgi:hypothetical protein
MPDIALQGVGSERHERKRKSLWTAWGREREGRHMVDEGYGEPQHVQCVFAPHWLQFGPQLPLPEQCDVPPGLPPHATQLP